MRDLRQDLLNSASAAYETLISSPDGGAPADRIRLWNQANAVLELFTTLNKEPLDYWLRNNRGTEEQLKMCRWHAKLLAGYFPKDGETKGDANAR